MQSHPRRKGQVRVCDYCGTEFYASPSRNKRFCTFGCACAASRRPLRDRALEKVAYDEQTGCWLWTGHRMRSGHGQINGEGGPQLAHRVLYELLVAPIPEGLTLDHLCRNPPCVNPAHLEPVTQQENTARGLRGRLKATCDNGHPRSPENWTTNGRGRTCRRCKQDREARDRAVGKR